MLNEEKIKMMTDIVRYKKSEEKHISDAQDYYMSDYLSKHMLASFVGFTICYVLIAFIVMMYNLEEILGIFNPEQIMAVLKKYIYFYAIGLIVYEIITAVIYVIRYGRARKALRIYISKIKRFMKKQET